MAAPAAHQGPRAQRSAIGAKGEAWTRRVLDGLGARDASTVAMHRLTAPGMGRGDMDHVVVRESAKGPVIVVIDSKVWAPATYWTFGGGRTFRGYRRFAPADHVTARLAAERLGEHLNDWQVSILTPLVVIWPSRAGRITSLHLLLGDGTPWVRGHDLARQLQRILPPSSGAPPDPALIAALDHLRRPRR